MSLLGTGRKYLNDWAKDKQQFKDILLAISQCGLKDSLTEINIDDCQITAQEGQTFVDELGMNNISVTDKH